MSFYIAFFRIKIIPQDDRLAPQPPKGGVRDTRLEVVLRPFDRLRMTAQDDRNIFSKL
jgi:hypothetical protein